MGVSAWVDCRSGARISWGRDPKRRDPATGGHNAFMRLACSLLLLAASVLAEDRYAAALQVFESARAEFAATGAQARLVPALQRLTALKDMRAMGPLAKALLETMTLENALREEARSVQARGAEAMDRTIALRQELEMLRKRERAGATDVAQQIHEREQELRSQTAIFERARTETERLDRRKRFALDLRSALAASAGTLLAEADDAESVEAGMRKLRQLLDVAQHEECLYLIGILRASDAKASAAHLIDILNHPKADEASVRAAASALARLRTRTGVDALLKLWERDPDGMGVNVRHVLSLAAERNLADLDAARGWAATLTD